MGWRAAECGECGDEGGDEDGDEDGGGGCDDAHGKGRQCEGGGKGSELKFLKILGWGPRTLQNLAQNLERLWSGSKSLNLSSVARLLGPKILVQNLKSAAPRRPKSQKRRSAAWPKILRIFNL